VKAFARLLGGLEAIGCDAETAWATLTRIAVDCVPALRTKVIRALVCQPTKVRTSDIAGVTALVTKTASRYLEDLSILQLADHSKQSGADNAPDLWEASRWLRNYFPESETEKYPYAHETLLSGLNTGSPSTSTTAPGGTFQSHFSIGRDAAMPTCLAELTEPDLSDPIGAHDEETTTIASSHQSRQQSTSPEPGATGATGATEPQQSTSPTPGAPGAPGATEPQLFKDSLTDQRWRETDAAFQKGWRS
jgi:hypothetical protein